MERALSVVVHIKVGRLDMIGVWRNEAGRKTYGGIRSVESLQVDEVRFESGRN